MWSFCPLHLQICMILQPVRTFCNVLLYSILYGYTIISIYYIISVSSYVLELAENGGLGWDVNFFDIFFVLVKKNLSSFFLNLNWISFSWLLRNFVFLYIWWYIFSCQGKQTKISDWQAIIRHVVFFLFS